MKEKQTLLLHVCGLGDGSQELKQGMHVEVGVNNEFRFGQVESRCLMDSSR